MRVFKKFLINMSILLLFMLISVGSIFIIPMIYHYFFVIDTVIELILPFIVGVVIGLAALITCVEENNKYG